MLEWTQVVCLSVCLCVCLSVTALQPKRLGRFWWNFTQIVSRTWVGVVFSDFWYLNLMTSSAAILNFRMRHSHGRNFCPILFKFGSDVAKGNPVFAIENQQNQSVTSGFTKNRAYDRSRFRPKIAAEIKIDRYRQVRCRFRLI